MIESWLAGKNMSLESDFSGKATVDCDPDLMTIAMTNLLGNAAKYGRKNGKIRLTVNRGPARLDVSVWNEGPGFKEEDREKLFRKFSRLDDPAHRKAKGTGVGLYTVWRIINQHGGRIEAHSRYGEWAEFAFWIPQPLQCYLQPPGDD
jgi:signal transduction histidine kinase